MRKYSGNVVYKGESGYGCICWDNDKIVSVELTGNVRPEAEWVLPGFVDTHVHGLGKGEAEGDKIALMAEFDPHFGVTSFLPTLDTVSRERTIAFARDCAEFTLSKRPENSSRILGGHIEGPYLDVVHGGGMALDILRAPDVNEVQEWLNAARGTLKIVTIAPELPGAFEVIRLLKQNGVIVSAGHTAMTAAGLPAAIDAGISRICHLFDAYDGREEHHGVSQVALSDAVLVDDRLTIELILDGFHVPAQLVQLAIRAAGIDRIVGITDAMPGTGLPDGIYVDSDGRDYTLNNEELCRLADNPDVIVGSCLTMNRAFANLVHRFGCTPAQASQIVSGNPARSIGCEKLTGALLPGLFADVTVLAPDLKTVLRTIIGGKEVYAL